MLTVSLLAWDDNPATPTIRDVPVFCRDGETRTLDLVVPNDARYLAALHPDEGMGVGVGTGVQK